jgi:hypothetical protein
MRLGDTPRPPPERILDFFFIAFLITIPAKAGMVLFYFTSIINPSIAIKAFGGKQIKAKRIWIRF